VAGAPRFFDEGNDAPQSRSSSTANLLVISDKMANDEVVGAVDATDTFVFATPSDAIITLNNPNAPFAAWEESDGSTTTNQTKTDVQSESAAQDGPAPVVFRVSSQYLIQASPVFKAAFTGGWKEGSKKGGCNEINAEDWDVEAMSLILNIIHARTKSLPEITSLEILCKFVVLVDYYKLTAQRADALDEISESLEAIKIEILTGKHGCSFECRAQLLGNLSLQL